MLSTVNNYVALSLPRPARHFSLPSLLLLSPCRKGVTMRDGKRRHMYKDSRVVIEERVYSGESCKSIAKAAGVSPSTVTREIRNNRTTKERLRRGRAKLAARCARYRHASMSAKRAWGAGPRMFDVRTAGRKVAKIPARTSSQGCTRPPMRGRMYVWLIRLRSYRTTNSPDYTPSSFERCYADQWTPFRDVWTRDYV